MQQITCSFRHRFRQHHKKNNVDSSTTLIRKKNNQSSKMVLTRNTQQQQAPPAAPGGGRRSGTSNYSTQETIDLMYLILAKLPIGADQWHEVEATHAEHYPDAHRDVCSICRKYSTLHRKNIPTGDPNCLLAVRLAKKAKYLIGLKADIGDGEEHFDIEEGYVHPQGRNGDPEGNHRAPAENTNSGNNSGNVSCDNSSGNSSGNNSGNVSRDNSSGNVSRDRNNADPPPQLVLQQASQQTGVSQLTQQEEAVPPIVATARAVTPGRAPRVRSYSSANSKQQGIIKALEACVDQRERASLRAREERQEAYQAIGSALGSLVTIAMQHFSPKAGRHKRKSSSSRSNDSDVDSSEDSDSDSD